MSHVDWSQLFLQREDVNGRYPAIWDLPIAPRYSDVLLGINTQAEHILEIGAGARGLEKKIKQKWPNSVYKSFDIDRSGHHDFYTLDEITGEYDLVCMFEIIEHVRPELALEILQKCYAVIKPGGLLMITTPNVFYPPGYLRDATHITPWCYDELGGIAQLAGFKASRLYRLYKESLLKMFMRRYCAYPLFRLLRIDFAKQVMLVAEKPSG